MKVVIQRVKEAKVCVGDQLISKIDKGMLVFVCVQRGDSAVDANFLADKLINLRIFEDDEKKMNLSVLEVKGELLVISQFTLAANCTKGRRPSFDKAASPQEAEELYEYFTKQLQQSTANVKSGIFGAMMEISLINDGPVTFIIDSKGND